MSSTEYHREYRAKNKLKRRGYVLKRKYGITNEQYESMMMAQSGSCGLCRTIPSTRKLCVDHCHSTGKVRGLLCDRCNLLVGWVEKSFSVPSQESILSYLK